MRTLVLAFLVLLAVGCEGDSGCYYRTLTTASDDAGCRKIASACTRCDDQPGGCYYIEGPDYCLNRSTCEAWPDAGPPAWWPDASPACL